MVALNGCPIRLLMLNAFRKDARENTSHIVSEKPEQGWGQSHEMQL